jgi:acetolactate synthase-1/2/3 large subunit
MIKPVILLGNGARRNPALIEYLCNLGVPVLTTWSGIDLVPEDCPTFCGRPGKLGQRAANIIQQKADILVCVGARLDMEQVCYNYDTFAPRACKIVYDVDPGELSKLPATWVKKQLDLTTNSITLDFEAAPEWLAWCKALYAKYRPELDGDGTPGDPFTFIHKLNVYRTTGDDIIALGSSGTIVNVALQAWRVKRGQRIFNFGNIGAMGLEASAIGAAYAYPNKRVICITGDGSFQMSFGMLNSLPPNVRIFVANNNGYASIRNMQDARFQGRRFGCDDESGLNLQLLEHGAGVHYFSINENFHQTPIVGTTGFTTDNPEDMTPKLTPRGLKEFMDYGN